jgi:hypothetical protein
LTPLPADVVELTPPALSLMRSSVLLVSPPNIGVGEKSLSLWSVNSTLYFFLSSILFSVGCGDRVLDMTSKYE